MQQLAHRSDHWQSLVAALLSAFAACGSACLGVSNPSRNVSEAESIAQPVSNVGEGSGYSISYVEATPAPGSPIVANVVLTFSVTAAYELEVADSGRVILVFEDEHDKPLFRGEAQPTQKIAGPRGEVTISGSANIPVGTRELHLYVPLLPDEMKRTSGELLIRYPVRRQ